MLEAAMRIGADVAPSDAYTINGQPGFSNDCYIGMKDVYPYVSFMN